MPDQGTLVTPVAKAGWRASRQTVAERAEQLSKQEAERIARKVWLLCAVWVMRFSSHLGGRLVILLWSNKCVLFSWPCLVPLAYLCRRVAQEGGGYSININRGGKQ